jgi:hypothetical protein
VLRQLDPAQMETEQASKLTRHLMGKCAAKRAYECKSNGTRAAEPFVGTAEGS